MNRKAMFLTCLFLILVQAAPVARGSAAAPSPEAVCNAWSEQKYDDAVRLADEIVGSAAVDPVGKVEAYKCQACAYVAKRQKQPARHSIQGMLGVDPTARFSPDYDYPPVVLALYHVVRDSLFSGATGSMDIRTVAIGDFQDNSVFKGKYKDYDFSLFRLALVHTVMADLAEATTLKIVDRQRTDQLLAEIQLGQSGFQNPTEAARFGQMLGAQSFIFGQFMILSKNTVRIDARVVHTATGEVILAREVTGDFSGDPKKFLALEKELVSALAEGLEQILATGGQKVQLDQMTSSYFQRKADGIKDRKAYVESKWCIAQALEMEDKGDYKGAVTLWMKVMQIDPENDVAGKRITALTSVAQG